MKYFGLEDQETPATNITIDPIQASTVAHKAVEGYIEKGANQILMLTQVPQVQQVLEDFGMRTYVQDLNKQRIINVLAAFGLWSAFMGVKNNLMKVGLVGGAVWLVSQNKDKIQMAFNEVKEELENINSEPLPSTTIA